LHSVKRKHKRQPGSTKETGKLRATAQSPAPATTQPMDVDLAPSIESTVDELLTDCKIDYLSRGSY